MRRGIDIQEIPRFRGSYLIIALYRTGRWMLGLPKFKTREDVYLSTLGTGEKFMVRDLRRNNLDQGKKGRWVYHLYHYSSLSTWSCVEEWKIRDYE